jgi:hypothetical protein
LDQWRWSSFSSSQRDGRSTRTTSLLPIQ